MSRSDSYPVAQNTAPPSEQYAPHGHLLSLASTYLNMTSVVNLTVVLHYWRGRAQRSAFPGHRYPVSLLCGLNRTPRILPDSEICNLSMYFKHPEDTVALHSATMASSRSGPSLLLAKDRPIANLTTDVIPNGSRWMGSI